MYVNLCTSMSDSKIIKPLAEIYRHCLDIKSLFASITKTNTYTYGQVYPTVRVRCVKKHNALKCFDCPKYATHCTGALLPYTAQLHNIYNRIYPSCRYKTTNCNLKP